MYDFTVLAEEEHNKDIFNSATKVLGLEVQEKKWAEKCVENIYPQESAHPNLTVIEFSTIYPLPDSDTTFVAGVQNLDVFSGMALFCLRRERCSLEDFSEKIRMIAQHERSKRWRGWGCKQVKPIPSLRVLDAYVSRSDLDSECRLKTVLYWLLTSEYPIDVREDVHTVK